MQAMLDRVGCPYQGAGPAGSFLALNKAAAKQLFRHAGLPTADWEFLPALRPRTGSRVCPIRFSSKAIPAGPLCAWAGRVTAAELDKVLAEIFAAGDEALIEPELKGREVTCGILGEEALPPILIEPVAGDFFDYESKYATGGAREICPAPIAPELTDRYGNWPWPPTGPWDSGATAGPTSFWMRTRA